MELSIFTVCLIHINCYTMTCLSYIQEKSSVVPVITSAGAQFQACKVSEGELTVTHL